MKRLTKEEKAQVRKAIKILPIRQQAIIYMRFWGYKTIQSMANKLEVSWATVNQELDQAQETLKEYFLVNPPASKRIEGVNHAA